MFNSPAPVPAAPNTWVTVPDLERALGTLLEQLPPGFATTYGTLARALGDPIAARWVAEHLLTHEHTQTCRCHRVVRAGGAIGLYGPDGTIHKRNRLANDGIPLAGDTVVPDALWSRFSGPAPLEALRRMQDALPEKLDLRETGLRPRKIAGVDVAYPTPKIARAACAILDADTLDVVWTCVIEEPVRFPYITTYLTFRELPTLEALWKAVTATGHIPNVVMVDGTGILHPRRAGIATAFGLFADIPTIGITKSHLCGRIAGPLEPLAPVPVIDHEETIGFAILPASRSSKPVFVSPGHRLGIQDAARITLQTFRNHRVPEPIHHADRLSKGR